MTKLNLRFVIGCTIIGLSFGQVFADTGSVPNFYECAGKQVKLVLGIGNNPPAGTVGYGISEAYFKLSLGKKDYSFFGNDIRTENTIFGDIKEVKLEINPNGINKSASVLIPSIMLQNMTPLDFKSQLILTTAVNPYIDPPFEGIINPSSFIDLSCNASKLY